MARKRVSGGDEVAQMCNEVKVIGKEGDWLRSSEEQQGVDSQSLGIQSVLSIPHETVINTLPYYFFSLLGPNIKIASEKKMRLVSQLVPPSQRP